jgi:hypothetical protein
MIELIKLFHFFKIFVKQCSKKILSSITQINTVIIFHKSLITCILQVLPSGEDLGGLLTT